MLDRSFWRNKSVLLTGHTGFKGAWAAVWLNRMGAKVTGIGLEPETEPNMFDLAGVGDLVSSHICDIRDSEALADIVAEARPQIIIHMAAQALVRRSYDEPLATLDTNIMGTANLLDAARKVDELEAILIITSDKVYANNETNTPFCESDRLGGHDPYSASKAAAEIVTASYVSSFFTDSNVKICTARGGNVIGGGDFSVDRIVPDIWRAAKAGKPLTLRYPNATRPWQHVLDCLNGYFHYVEAMVKSGGSDLASALNFGPDGTISFTVAELADAMQKALDTDAGWVKEKGPVKREMAALSLDTSLSRAVLDWQDRLPGRASLEWTAQWYLALRENNDMGNFSGQQIDRFLELDR